ncbi:MAG: flavin reductase family protein [Bacilli bacterium]
MSLRAYNHSVSIVTKKEEEKIYACTIAWMCQVGYEEVIGLIGEQSSTGKTLKKGDKVAINVCSKEMKDFASFVGSTSSLEVNKFASHSYCEKDGYITLEESKVILLCEVKDILHLEGIQDDNLVYFHVKEYQVNEEADYLLMSDMD